MLVSWITKIILHIKLHREDQAWKAIVPKLKKQSLDLRWQEVGQSITSLDCFALKKGAQQSSLTIRQRWRNRWANSQNWPFQCAPPIRPSEGGILESAAVTWFLTWTIFIYLDLFRLVDDEFVSVCLSVCLSLDIEFQLKKLLIDFGATCIFELS